MKTLINILLSLVTVVLIILALPLLLFWYKGVDKHG